MTNSKCGQLIQTANERTAVNKQPLSFAYCQQLFK